MALDITGKVGWWSGSVGVAPAYDADAQAFITVASITNSTQQTAINQLVLDLKSANIWTKMKAIYPFVGGTASSHKFNLKDPRDLDAAYRLVFNGGGTHSINGYSGNNSNGYANTNLVPSSELTLNNIHMSYYNRINVLEDRYDIGAEQTSPKRAVYSAVSWSGGGQAIYFAINSNEKGIMYSDSRKFFITNKTATNIISGFINTNKTSFSVTDTTLPSIPIFINSRNINGTNDYSNNKQCAFASIGDGLTDTEATAFYNAVQAYQTTLGRQV